MDLYNFEETVFQKYLDTFTINFNKGEFRYKPSPSDSDYNKATIYGITDIIHCLYLIGQLDIYLPSNSSILKSWISTIYSFQNSTGFYKLDNEEDNAGYQPWHSTAYTTASLYVLNVKPKYNNSFYANIATNQTLWNDTFYPLLNMTQGQQLGCPSIHSCCHKIVGIPATIVGEGNKEKYSKFINWWFNDFIYPNLNKQYGVLCPQQDIDTKGINTCLGSGAAVHFFDKFTNTPYPYPINVYNFMQSLQNNASSKCQGLWNPSCSMSGDQDMDGITQYTNVAYQMNKYEWNTTIINTCQSMLQFYVPKLNNATYVLQKMSGDTHKLPGILGAVGQCLMYFPQLVQTKYPWRCCAPFM